MRQSLLATFAATCISLAAAPIVPNIIAERASSPQADKWVDSVYNSLDLRGRVAQLMCPKVVPTQGANSRAVIRRLVHDQGVGAILFTEGSVAQYAEMINYAQSIARVPVIFTFDGEWGLSMRVRKTTRFPRNMSLGAIRDTSLIYLYGNEMARQCRELGIQVNFAPVADVNSNPANPVIGDRSFGDNPRRVATLVSAYSRGLEDGGVQAVAKHFPGHGDTHGDSHKLLPAISRTRAGLDTIEYVPFRRFINDGGSAIMVGHISVPAIDKSGVATSLTTKTYKILRDKMDFDGLVYTDALGMKGAVTADGANNSVAALRAGADVLECTNAERDIDAVLAAIKAGKISEKDIETHCRRVLRHKYALGMATLQPIDLNGLSERINTPQADSLNRALTRAMMTVVYNRDETLPLADLEKRSIAVVNIGAGADNEFAEFCHRYANVDVYALPDGTVSKKTQDQIAKHNTVVLAVYNNKAPSFAAFNTLKDLPGTIGVFFVNPYRAARFVDAAPNMDAVVMAYEDLPLAREYAAQAIFGGINVDGRLPVALGKTAASGAGVSLKKNRLGYSTPIMQGMDAALADSIDALVNKALADGATPGCQVLVARGGDVVVDKAYGTLTAGGAPVTRQTLYDLASVSKALGTLPGVMMAVDRNMMDIDVPASQYIPGLRGTGKDSITVRQLLFHETGMPASLNMFNIMIDTASYTGKLITGKPDAMHPVFIQKGAYGHRDGCLRTDITSTVKDAEHPWQAARGIYVGQAAMDTIMNRIYTIPLRKNNNYNYSCLNFALLMDAEQNATGIAHNTWCADSLWTPLGAWSISYRPYERFDNTMIAPTENDTYLRRQIVQGTVHDETAAFSGGVQGNAGLFANADDLAKICAMWLNGGEYGGRRYLSPETVALFTETKSPTCRRGLGFDKPDMVHPEWSPTCDEAPADTYGHLGFTGTVFWVVPSQDLIFIFLTNRVNPTRDTPVFNSSGLRPNLMRAVLKAIPGAVADSATQQ